MSLKLLPNEYIFILGRYPELSRKEIFAVLKMQGESPVIRLTSDQALIIQTQKPLSIENINKTLGGTVKIGKVIHQLIMGETISETKVVQYLTSDALFIDILENVSEKVSIGMSYYHADKGEDKGMHYKLESMTKAFKSHLEAQGFKVRYPRLEGVSLSSASVDKNKLITQGVEILLIQTEDTLFIGKTLAVQEFEAFSKRDYGRPSRDMESGIMPPKIARMMINLAEVKTDAKIIDPFCGSGTILQEALVLHYLNITGTDLSSKAIEDSTKNITWLTQRNEELKQPTIEQCDVVELVERFGPASFDAVIGEPYMGPNFQQTPLLAVLQKNRDDLELFYNNALTSLSQILKPNGVMVMVFPIFHTGHHYLHMDIFAKIHTLGLNLVPLSENKRQTITIGNRYDFVLREIVLLKKKDN